MAIDGGVQTPEAVAFLQWLEEFRRIHPPQVPPERTAPEWLDQVYGIFADDPTFDEAVRLGQEWRRTEPSKDNFIDHPQI